MGLADTLDKVYPRAMWPSTQKLARLGAWGIPVVGVLFYAVQPFDWIQTTVGLKKEEQGHGH